MTTFNIYLSHHTTDARTAAKSLGFGFVDTVSASAFVYPTTPLQTRLPTDTETINAATGSGDAVKSSLIHTIDLESYGVAGYDQTPIGDANSPNTIVSNANNLAHILQTYRSASAPGLLLGNYWSPMCTYAGSPSMTPGDSRYANWIARNSAIGPIVSPYIDFCAPILYLNNAADFDAGNWFSALIIMVSECNRVAPGKPVMPYLQPYYTNGSGAIDSVRFAAMLHAVRTLTPSCVIWSNDAPVNGVMWSPPPSWIVTAQAVLNEWSNG